MRGEMYRGQLEEHFPENLEIGGVRFEKARGLRYGWNPGQPAAFYREVGAEGPCLGNMRVIQENPEKKLGYINLEDANAALSLMQKLHSVYGEQQKIATVIKHVNPSGVAKDVFLVDAFVKAWNCNSKSAFGGVVGLSDVIDEDVAVLLGSKDYFVEAVVAPGYTDSAMELLARKKNLRVIEVDPLEVIVDSPVEYKRVRGGLLVQERYDTKITSPDKFNIVSDRQPTHEERDAAVFNWIVCGFVRSNAIVIGGKDQTIGIGAGQQSRIDSFELAVKYANGRSRLGCKGRVAASDAFFPYHDCVELAAKEGITAIVYTLGSDNDRKSIDAANRNNIAMLDTGERCFTHG